MPEMPEVATKETKEGLLAFAEHWFAMVNYSYQTGNLSPIKEITGEHCATCDNIFENAKKSFANGGWINGGSMSIERKETKFQEFDLPIGKRGYRLLLILQQADSTVFNADGSIEHKGDGFSKRGNIMYCSYADGKWTMEAVAAPQGSK